MLNLNDIKNLLQHNKITDFVKLNKLTPRDIAEFTNRNTQWAVKLFQHLEPKHAARAFKFLRRNKQEIIIKSLPEEKAAELLNALQPDDRTAFLEELPGNYVKELLKVLTPEHRAKTLELLGYDEGSVGRLMTPDYVSIKTSETCQEVLALIRQRGQATETLNWLFVIDDKGVLIDDINIKDFLIVDPGTRVAEIMDYQFIALIISSGGNSGSQASSIIIRAMALGEIGFRDWWRVVRREVLSGLVLGTILGVVGFLRVFFWQEFHFYNYGPHYMKIATTVFFALIGVVMWAVIIKMEFLPEENTEKT